MSDALYTDCTHLDLADFTAEPFANGCEDCLREGTRWVHLRMCRTCAHIGCCDSSPRKHASAHAAATPHPLISSFEPGEDWWWCYIDEVALAVPEAPDFSHT